MPTPESQARKTNFIRMKVLGLLLMVGGSNLNLGKKKYRTGVNSIKKYAFYSIYSKFQKNRLYLYNEGLLYLLRA
jgi:hypothetical protein